MSQDEQATPTPKTVDEKIEAALQMVSDLCNQRRTWTMSIPARPDYDPDLVIADALSTAKHALSEAKAEAERAQSLFAASVRDAERHYAEAERLREALEKVERWQFPPTGKFWESGTPVSYGAAYGSNGERDYMRNVARAALAATRKEDSGG